MRSLLLLLLLSLLTGCPEGSSQGTQNSPVPSQTSAIDPISLSRLQGRTFSSAYGQFSFNGQTVTDSHCGASYSVVSTIESDGVVQIIGDLIASSYTPPSNNDCLITFSDTRYFNARCQAGIMTESVGYRITWTIVAISGGIEAIRLVRSINKAGACATLLPIYETLQMNPENLF